MRSTFALSLAAVAGLAAAQSTAQQNYPYQIDPESVPGSTREYWCQQNLAQCPLICLQQPGVTTQTTDANDCDSDNLTYNCVCDNGISPNITQYSQTLPYFICTEWGNQCVNNCNGDSTCGSKCRADHPCGAQDPFKGNATLSSILAASSTAAAAASATSHIPVTGFGGAAATSAAGGSGSTGAAAATFVPGAATSMAVLFGTVFFGFAAFL
ncbi:hypothetical protein E8E13_004926 [Curvularia kusanoi]|uniref:DUF7707 domain-containing protein n=1 Tax=Curvularia kusanoi TaxID=90978 RepID=A0A9P4TCE4_CURKU|nr:hypothetical protein E8E13_004926 [Curvularia kusanoi]